MARATKSTETLPPPDNSTEEPAESALSAKMWQSNPDVQAIHNAFILGWSLVELRSRVQVAALDTRKLPSAATNDTPIASLNTADPLQLVAATNDSLLRASRLRTIFNSIVTLQRNKFPTSVTVNTLYDPPSKEEVEYLYPPEPDYANIGINPLGKDKAGNLIWADFRLFDITRRAINCLTLLLVMPQDSLVPRLVADQQSSLTKRIIQSAEEERSKDPSSDVHSLATTAVDAYEQNNSKIRDGGDSSTDQGKAITTLSFLTVRLLQAWDGYLRERFTAEGVGVNNLLTLVAYEAGRNMAAISWNTSVNTILLENQAEENAGPDSTKMELWYQAWKKTFTDSSLVQVLHQITALSTVLDDAYYQTHEKPVALTTKEQQDDLLIRPDPALPSQILQAVRQSVEYWQRMILWLDTPSNASVDGQTKPSDQMKPEDWQHLRNALIEQSGIWFNLMTGQQDLRGFTVENITHEFLDEAIKNFGEFAQRDLSAAAKEASQKVGDIVDTAVDAVADISKNATRAAKNALDVLFNSVRPWLLGIGLVGLLLLGYFGYLVITGQVEGSSLITGITTLLASVAGWLGIQKTKSDGEKNLTEQIETEKEDKTQKIQQKKAGMTSTLADVGSGLTSTINNAFGQAGNFLLEAYNKGLQRIQIELQLLNSGVAITHPLVEFLVRHYAIEGDFGFLTEVIWDTKSRKLQLKRVVDAAFGPLSILLGSPTSDNSRIDSQGSNSQAAD